MQLALEYEPSRAILPLLGTQHRTLLDAFYSGRRLTTMEAFKDFGITTISQRCGELKDLGWPIKSERVPGKTYKRYWVDFSQ